MRAAGGAWGVSEWAARGDVANIGSLPTISNAATAEVLEQLFEQPTYLFSIGMESMDYSLCNITYYSLSV